MRHPWIEFRERSGFSQQQVANLLGVSRSFIVKMESSILSDVPRNKTLTSLSDLYEVPEQELLVTWRTFIKSQRDDFKTTYPSFSEVLRDYRLRTHPLKFYRGIIGLSQVGFCKGLCLHPGPVANYEKNTQRGIPLSLVLACNDMAWDYGPLESAVTEWRINGYADRVA